MGLCVELGLKAELKLGLGLGLGFGGGVAVAGNLWVVMDAWGLPRAFPGCSRGSGVRLTPHRRRRKRSQWEPRPDARRGLGGNNDMKTHNETLCN